MVSISLFIVTSHDSDAVSHAHQLGVDGVCQPIISHVNRNTIFGTNNHKGTRMISKGQHKLALTGCDHELKFSHVIELRFNLYANESCDSTSSGVISS